MKLLPCDYVYKDNINVYKVNNCLNLLLLIYDSISVVDIDKHSKQEQINKNLKF